MLPAFLITLLVSLIIVNAMGQTKAADNDEAVVVVEHSAEFPSGMDNFYKFIAANIQYPEQALKDGVQGRIYLSFIVEKDGQLTNIKVLKGLGAGLDEESVRLLTISPKWKPGEQNNRKVRQRVSLPISFVIQKSVPETQVSEDTSKIYSSVEPNAQFPGGESALYSFLGKTLRYPALARDKGTQGKVIVTFVVEKDGSLSDIKILHGIGNGCDEEAARVFGLSPKWIPGKQKDVIVRQQFTIPLKFSLGYH